MKQQQVCYLICFDRPYVAKTGKKQKQARHYIGWTVNLERRIHLHKTNQGARLLQVVNAEGIGWQVVRTWPDDGRDLEIKLKKRGSRFLCPCCNEKVAAAVATIANQDAAAAGA